jgi:hypothetical protein
MKLGFMRTVHREKADEQRRSRRRESRKSESAHAARDP